MGEIEGPGDIGVDHVAPGCDVLVEEGVAQAMACVGQQRVDGAVADQLDQRIDARQGGEIDADLLDRGAQGAERLGGRP